MSNKYKYLLGGAYGWRYAIENANGTSYWLMEHEGTGLHALLGDISLVVTRPSEDDKVILSEDVSELPFVTLCTILNNVARDEYDYIKAIKAIKHNNNKH